MCLSIMSIIRTTVGKSTTCGRQKSIVDGYAPSYGRAPDQSYDVARLEKHINNATTIRPSGIRKAEINGHAYSSPFSAYEGAYPQFSFSTPCLDFSHRAFNLIAKSKHKPIEMRVVTIVLNDDTLDRRGGPLFGYGKDKHAMLLVDGTIYDNGYLTDVPFDYEYFSHYGREIDNMWKMKIAGVDMAIARKTGCRERS